MLSYRIEISPDDNGTMLVTCPLLSEVTTFGSDEANAARNAVSAIEEALAARVAHGEDIPVDDSDQREGLVVRVPLQSTIKALLYLACRRQGVTRADLMRRLGWHREQVDRLFRFDHATRLDQFEAAFHTIGQELDLELRAA
jgi:antitoxin HicB